MAKVSVTVTSQPFSAFHCLRATQHGCHPRSSNSKKKKREREGERENMQVETLFCCFCTFSDQLRLRFDVAATSSVHVISGGKREDVGGRGRGEGVERWGCYKLKKTKKQKHVMLIKEQNTFETEF